MSTHKKNTFKFFLISLVILFFSIGIVVLSYYKKTFADVRTTHDTSSPYTPNEFTEDWVATEMTSDTVDYDGFWGGSIGNTFTRIREKSTSFNAWYTADKRSMDTWMIDGEVEQLRTGNHAQYFTFSTDTEGDLAIPVFNWAGSLYNWDGRMNTEKQKAVTKWHVTGHSH